MRDALHPLSHTLNLRESQGKQIYAVTPCPRKKKKIRAYRVRGVFKIFRDMLAAPLREEPK